MTLLEKINSLTWYDLINKLKDILKGLAGQGGDSRPYKVYTALLSQSGTNAPVATVLENTLGDTITYTFLNTGSFEVVNNSNSFPYSKTTLILNSNQPGTLFLGGTEEDPDGNTIKLNKYSVSGGNLILQNILSNAKIEIRVYS